MNQRHMNFAFPFIAFRPLSLRPLSISLLLTLFAVNSFAQETISLDTDLSRNDEQAATIEVDKIVASLDGEPVTLFELKEKVTPVLSRLKTPLQSRKGMVQRAQVLEQGMKNMLLEKMLLKEAAAQRIQVGDEEISAYVNEIKKQNGVDEAGFVSILASKGLSLEDYKKDVRLDIIRGRLISRRMSSKINIVEEDIDRYIENRPELMPEKNSVKILLIRYRLAEFPDASEEQVLEQVERVREAVLKGAPIAKVDPAHFQDLGYVERDQLKKRMKRMIEEYSVGEVSEVAKIDNSFVFFEVAGEVDESGELNDAMRSEIRESLYRERYQEEVERYLGEELPKKYHVESKI